MSRRGLPVSATPPVRHASADVVVRVEVPGVELRQHGNARMSVRERIGAVKRARDTVGVVLAAKARTRPPLPVVVTLTRLAPGNPMDSDNLSSACKPVRDAVALWLGVADGDPRVTWQCIGQRGAWGVRVEAVPWSPRREGVRVVSHSRVEVRVSRGAMSAALARAAKGEPLRLVACGAVVTVEATEEQ